MLLLVGIPGFITNNKVYVVAKNKNITKASEELYHDEVLGYDVDNQEICEGDILRDMWALTEKIEDLEDPRMYCAVVADDGKAYAISIDDSTRASEIRKKECIPDEEAIPQLIKTIHAMEYYEVYHSSTIKIDIVELRKIVNARLKEKPIEKDIIDFNGEIASFKRNGMNIGEIRDGDYSFNEYKDIWAVQFVELCIDHIDYAWKKRTPSEETFIAGINTPKGIVTRTVSMEYWDDFNVTELEEAPKYDSPSIEEFKIRIKSLRELKKQ